MLIAVKHLTVVKEGQGFRNLLPSDGPHEVDDAVARELIEAKVATAVEETAIEEAPTAEEAPIVEAKQEPKPEAKVEPKAKPKGSKHL
jgi:hypothetical protein